jgi:hypothetical protein
MSALLWAVFLLIPDKTNFEEGLFLAGTLGAPIVLPILTILSWILYFSGQ